MQIVETSRTTKETDISLRLDIMGAGKNNIETPVNFFSHMLREFSWHGKFDMDLSAKSLDCDSHHLIEDVAIVLGQAFCKALGNKRGIARYGSVFIPMDDALCHCVIDISGRAYCVCDFNLKDEKTSDFETVLLVHFFNTFAQNAGITLHIRQLAGFDTHHIIEAAFKAFARALKTACSIDEANKDELPSTKGVL